MNFNDLTEEQRKRAREAKTPEEMLALAQEEGFELTDAQLEGVAGGTEGWCSSFCGTWTDYLGDDSSVAADTYSASSCLSRASSS